MRRLPAVYGSMLLAVLWICTSTSFSAGTDGNPTEEKLLELLRPFFQQAAQARREHTVAPIQVPAKVVTWRDVQAAHLAWARRVWIEPFRKRLKGNPTDAAVSAFVDRATEVWVSAQWKPEKPVALADEGRKLLAQGCDDPLPQFLAGVLDYWAYDDWRAVMKTYDKAYKRVSADRTISRVLASFLAAKYAQAIERSSHNSRVYRKQAMAWFLESLTDGSYDAKDDAIFVYHQLRHIAPVLSIAQLRDIKPAPCLSEWARHTLMGYAEVEAAWADRGGGWASEVTEKGWKGLREHLLKAREELTQAWKLRPDRPEAPCEMIRVVMGGQGAEGDTERLWFDRTIAAQFDFPSAYSQMLWAYRPRWYGSHEMMLEFGKACLATRRFDTEVPDNFFRACNDIASELKDWRTFYRRSEVAQPLLELSQQMVEEPTRQQQKPMRQSLLAVNAWLAGDYPLAAKTLAALDGKLHSDARDKLKRYDSDPATFAAEVLVCSGTARADFEKAESLFRECDFDAAESAYRRAGRNAGADAKPVIDSRLAVLDVERRLAQGEWVKLTPDPLLSQWDVRQGNWTVDARGNLVAQGTDGPALILYRGRVGPEFEIRGDAEILAKENCCQRLDVAFGWQRELTGDTWVTCSLAHRGHGPYFGSLLNSYYQAGEPDVKNVKLEPANHFFVCCHDGRITFRVNYRTIFDEHQPKEKLHVAVNDGLIGFCGSFFCRQNTLKIRNIEVRRVPPQDAVDLADLKTSVKAQWNRPAEDHSPVLNISLRLQGGAAAQASAYGEVKLDALQDEHGNALAASGPALAAPGKGQPPMLRIDRNGSEHSNGGVQVSLAVQKPGTIEKLGELRGSVALRTGGRYQTLVLKDAIKRPTGSAVEDPTLKALGVVVKVKPDVAKQRDQQRRQDASAKQLLIETQWDRNSITHCEVLDGQAKLLTPANITVEPKPDKLIFRLAFAEKIPEDSELRLTVHCDAQKVRVPFALSDIDVPPAANAPQQAVSVAQGVGAKDSAPKASPSEILEKVKSTYAAMQTFKAEGTVVSDIDVLGRKTSIKTSFSIVLKKPNLYVISWDQKFMRMHGISQSGTVWNDGTQAYLYTGIMHAYAKFRDDAMALAGATGVSSGVASTIPALFLTAIKSPCQPFSGLKDLKFDKDEKIGDDDCHVISGSSWGSKKESFWISKKSYLIRQHYRSLEAPEGGRKMPQYTAAQIDQTLKAMGREVTEENRKEIREMMESSAKMLQTMNLKGSLTQTYASVSSPELNKKEFAFVPPGDAVLKKSLFDGVSSKGKNAVDAILSHVKDFPTTPPARLDKATKALVSAANEAERFYALRDVAKQSFETGNISDARKYAKELLTLAEKFPKDWNYGNAIHDSHMVLGRIALKEGKTEEAKRHLLEAGKTPGSPQLNSFGPNMSLARDLLEKGERETVLQYFQLCRKFWRMGHDQLDQWTKDVKAGQTPDFGANLVY